MKNELTDAEQAWITELNRLGTEKGFDGFPVPSDELHILLWAFEGLTPLEAIEQLEPLEPAPDDET